MPVSVTEPRPHQEEQGLSDHTLEIGSSPPPIILDSNDTNMYESISNDSDGEEEETVYSDPMSLTSQEARKAKHSHHKRKGRKTDHDDTISQKKKRQFSGFDLELQEYKKKLEVMELEIRLGIPPSKFTQELRNIHNPSKKKIKREITIPNRIVIGGYANNLKPEVFKAVLALGYVFVVTWVTSLTMVIVHDRVPSMEKFPPLPDLFLDNIPHIPYAFEMCEITGTLLFCLFCGVLFFHKHRFILIRRFFALSGTVFLLRCVTMLITSLSVPGAHLKCNPRPYGDWFQKLHYAYLIWKGAGMSIQGVRTCGDYMFSGHTVALTMLNFFVTEYTTRRMYYLHTLSWLLNMFGIFFILAAHEHYSIDVFIAFYITSRLFLYYHTLANNNMIQRDSKRTKVWFPLFSYFESQVNGIVPNQYEWPITIERLQNWILTTIRLVEAKWKDLIPNPNEGFLRTKFFFKPQAATVNKDE